MHSSSLPGPGRRSIVLLVGALFAVGIVARLLPLVDGSGRDLRQFPTEDGYLMMTIARHIALGQGMSTAEGLIPSNGTQPAFSLIEALCFALVGCDRRAGVLTIELVQLAIAMASAWALFALGRRVLGKRPWGRDAALVAAGAWFASSNVIPHSMNCLETGFYVLMVLLSVLHWHRFRQKTQPGDAARMGSAALAGALLGLTFWARIDAVFLIAALTLVHAASEWRRQRIRAGLLEALVAGSLAVAIASPWLLYGKIRFGSFMPVSGLAESGKGWFANLPLLPATLFRYLSVVVPVPHDLGSRLPVIAACSVLVLSAVVLFGRLSRRVQGDERWLLAVGSLFLLGLSAYYGLVFGAGHFLDRYLFPASPFLALLDLACVFAWAYMHKATRWLRPAGLMSAALLLMLVTSLGARGYARGREHMHFQVVDWAIRNVPGEAWIAAVQTGTLGFFHDRTVNLDGKVNPEALHMLRQDRIPDYVVSSRWGTERASIAYLLDWQGIAAWTGIAEIHSNFDLVVDDTGRNLAVFRRKGPSFLSVE
jgi:hypothetical protein